MKFGWLWESTTRQNDLWSKDLESPAHQHIAQCGNACINVVASDVSSSLRWKEASGMDRPHFWQEGRSLKKARIDVHSRISKAGCRGFQYMEVQQLGSLVRRLARCSCWWQERWVRMKEEARRRFERELVLPRRRNSTAIPKGKVDINNKPLTSACVEPKTQMPETAWLKE